MKKLIEPNFELEKSVIEFSKKHIAGVDEVGRGALAGPIVAAAVVFKDYDDIIQLLGGIKDSKLLSSSKREKLDQIIKESAHSYAVGVVDVEEIDGFGIGAANVLAFKRALDQLVLCDFAFIDGRKFRGFEYPYRCVVKGESKSISIAAASIVAKVHRDKLMDQLHRNFKGYGFSHNKGYGTDEHLAAVKNIGICKAHRKSFLKEYLNLNNTLF